ncbi:hypothetical protein OSTOST_18952 [Ostertagia ostertagi]
MSAEQLVSRHVPHQIPHAPGNASQMSVNVILAIFATRVHVFQNTPVPILAPSSLSCHRPSTLSTRDELSLIIYRHISHTTANNLDILRAPPASIMCSASLVSPSVTVGTTCATRTA